MKEDVVCVCRLTWNVALERATRKLPHMLNGRRILRVGEKDLFTYRWIVSVRRKLALDQQ